MVNRVKFFIVLGIVTFLLAGCSAKSGGCGCSFTSSPYKTTLEDF